MVLLFDALDANGLARRDDLAGLRVLVRGADFPDAHGEGADVDEALASVQLPQLPRTERKRGAPCPALLLLENFGDVARLANAASVSSGVPQGVNQVVLLSPHIDEKPAAGAVGGQSRVVLLPGREGLPIVLRGGAQGADPLGPLGLVLVLEGGDARRVRNELHVQGVGVLRRLDGRLLALRAAAREEEGDDRPAALVRRRVDLLHFLAVHAHPERTGAAEGASSQ
mmetsp:Transcript_77795/g.197644  ORF Transcript_77795/g.197644 Transcript_77795/m.197644 type:complete len:226 (+) Transcript_77795:843-1520(+)